MKGFLMVQTGADEACQHIRNCKSRIELRRNLIYEKAHMNRTTIIKAINARRRKLWNGNP